MPPNKVKGGGQAPWADAMIPGQLYLRFEPEFRLSIRVMDMDVWRCLLARDEVEPIPTVAKDCRAHLPMLHRSDSAPDNDAA